MTDDTTIDEAPPKEEESEPDPREEATQALLNALLDVFDQNFGDQFEQARFDIVQKEEDEEKERWEFSLQGRGSDNEDSSGEEKGKYEFFLDPLSGGESAQKEKVYAKIRSEEEEGKINLHIKGSGK